MKRLLPRLALIVAAVSLSGCYYDPGYSYVRSGSYGGDAYYGQSAPTYYAAPSYYGGYDPGYYGSGYDGGCCYAPGVGIGISRGWYGGSGYSRGYRHERDRHDGYRHYRGGAYHGQGTQPSGGRPPAQPASRSSNHHGSDDRRRHNGDQRH